MLEYLWKCSRYILNKMNRMTLISVIIPTFTFSIVPGGRKKPRKVTNVIKKQGNIILKT